MLTHVVLACLTVPASLCLPCSSVGLACFVWLFSSPAPYILHPFPFLFPMVCFSVFPRLVTSLLARFVIVVVLGHIWTLTLSFLHQPFLSFLPLYYNFLSLISFPFIFSLLLFGHVITIGWPTLNLPLLPLITFLFTSFTTVITFSFSLRHPSLPFWLHCPGPGVYLNQAIYYFLKRCFTLPLLCVVALRSSISSTPYLIFPSTNLSYFFHYLCSISLSFLSYTTY